jgi:hypothetical protein
MGVFGMLICLLAQFVGCQNIWLMAEERGIGMDVFAVSKISGLMAANKSCREFNDYEKKIMYPCRVVEWPSPTESEENEWIVAIF